MCRCIHAKRHASTNTDDNKQDINQSLKVLNSALQSFHSTLDLLQTLCQKSSMMTLHNWGLDRKSIINIGMTKISQSSQTRIRNI